MQNKREVINYLVFGVLTTLVNIISYWVLAKGFDLDYKLATTIAWILSVLFAYVTNKKYVFQSERTDLTTVVKEFGSFVFFRLLSYLVDIALMVVLVEWVRTDDLVAKIIANVVVVVMNYFASKLVIFRKST